jgi:hypothetical protein
MTVPIRHDAPVSVPDDDVGGTITWPLPRIHEISLGIFLQQLDKAGEMVYAVFSKLHGEVNGRNASIFTYRAKASLL